ncbi:MAG: OPT family oligopeptide transporter [Candidatus Electryonea clarkiae]|nr:OPT family oligopeptide transporter [Candidatus Electryonea clarkiae]MDP8286798.1 OPT family oligopeptide transporter [Candidatus Electryonea clarkiae]
MKSVSELTFRAVISGLFVGCLIAASNVCIGLKIGWTFGASITAAVISFAIFSGIRNLKNPYTAGENLISATAGSSAGTMASAGGFTAAIPALEMIRLENGQGPLSIGALMIWAISIAFLGVHFAVPLRKQMIVVDKLRYPTGTAAAETIKAMFASGVEAMKKTKVLLWSAIFAAFLKILFEVEDLFDFQLIGLRRFENLSFDDFGIFGIVILGASVPALYLGVNFSAMMLGSGILIGKKVGWSLFAGSIIAWGIITPILLHNGTVEVKPNMGAVTSALVSVQEAESKSDWALKRAKAASARENTEAIRRADLLASHREGVNTVDILRFFEAPPELLRQAGMHPGEDAQPVPVITNPPDTSSMYRAGFVWVLWTGVSLMITASFVSLGMQWRSIVNTFTSLKSAAKGSKSDGEEEDAPDPYPMKYWVVGMALATFLTSFLAYTYFGIPIWMGILAVILSLLIAAIAVRATGETDINPVGGMGKITQVVYGALAPGMIQTNLMAAGITAAGASQAGDLMHDLKAGYILKVSIRRQVITQLIGVVVGVFAATLTFRVLTKAYEIPGPEFPGPAVHAWHKMATVLAVGFDALPAGALWGAAVGAVLGVILPLLAKASPKVGKYLPSSVAFGIAFMVPAVYSIAMWLGAILFASYEKRNKDRADRYGFSLASGLIAGEGLMMVVVAVIIVLKEVVFA